MTSKKKGPYAAEEFEGGQVVGGLAKVENASQALSLALEVDPAKWAKGETVVVVLRCDVTKIAFASVKGAEDLELREHVLRATDATIAPEEVYSILVTAINEQQDRIQRAREEREGTQRLPLPDGS